MSFSTRHTYARGLFLAALLGTLPSAAYASEDTYVPPAFGAPDSYVPPQLQAADIVEHRGEVIDLALEFQTGSGDTVRLQELFEGEKPVLLTLNYYECEAVCSTQLNQLIRSIEELELAGDEFKIVTVSIDPGEGPMLAAAAGQWRDETLLRSDVEWHFLVGNEPEITALSEDVGFQYAYDEDTDQYGHLAALFFIAPDGTISQYLYGIEYPAWQLEMALGEAATGVLGSPLRRIVLSCFHYVDGTYSLWAFGLMRMLASLCAIVLFVFLGILWRRERLNRRAETTA